MSDTELRQLERDAAASDDPAVLEKLDLVRHRSGLPSLFDDMLEQHRAFTKKVVDKGPSLLERKLRFFMESHRDVIKTLSWGQYNMYNDETFDFNYGNIEIEFTPKVLKMIEANNPFTNVKFSGMQPTSDNYGKYCLDLLTQGGEMITATKRRAEWNTRDQPKHKEGPILDKLEKEWADKIGAAITYVEMFDSEIGSACDILEAMFGRDIRISISEDGNLSKEGDYRD